MARDLETIARQLRNHLPGYGALTRVVPLSAGHSNETYLLEGVDRILRMPPSEEGLQPPYDMARQHAVLAAVGRSAEGPPVPRVFELQTEPALLGDPFFIMERLPGAGFEHDLPEWIERGGEAACASVCAQWIDAVARVSRVPVAGLPLATRSPREEAQHLLALAAKAAAPAELIAVLHSLEAEPPRPSGMPTLVHGDPKYANCVWHEGRLVGLLDWEGAQVGDPLLDLGYLISFFNTGRRQGKLFGLPNAGWWPRARMVAAWEEATGRVATDLHLFEALALCKIVGVLAMGVALYRSARATDPRFATWEAALPNFMLAIRRRLDAGETR